MTEQLSFLHSYRVIWILQSDRGEHEHFSDELDTTTLLSSVLSLEVCISYLDIKVKYHHDDRAVPCNEASQQNLSLLSKILSLSCVSSGIRTGFKILSNRIPWKFSMVPRLRYQWTHFRFISDKSLQTQWRMVRVRSEAESPHVNTNPVFFTHSTSHLSPLS